MALLRGEDSTSAVRHLSVLLDAFRHFPALLGPFRPLWALVGRLSAVCGPLGAARRSRCGQSGVRAWERPCGNFCSWS